MKETQKTREEEQGLSLQDVKQMLVELGKKRGSLTYAEIAKRLTPFDQDPDQLDEFFDHLV